MVGLSKLFKETDIRRFEKSYEQKVSDAEKTYLAAKKSYERTLEKFIVKSITWTNYEYLWARAYDVSLDRYRTVLAPDRIDVLEVLIWLHRNDLQDDDFYLQG